MPHTGVEAKPRWREIPRAVRQATESALGSSVRRATRVWGGYGPTPTFRLLLADGRRAFFKATGPADNDFARSALIREQRVYADLSALIAPWAPQHYGGFALDPWQVLLLEDVGPKSVPPWTRASARGVARGLAAFHRSTYGKPLPPWIEPPEQYGVRVARIWDVLEESGDLEEVAALAGDQRNEASRWLQAAMLALTESAQHLSGIKAPHALLHGDVRSDNLRWSEKGLRLFDWPFADAGPAEFDLAAFAQSVTTEGGPEPEQIIAWYRECGDVRPGALDASVASVAGYFANLAWREDIPGLPRVRTFQCAQLRVSLRWAAARLGLPPPTWIESLSR